MKRLRQEAKEEMQRLKEELKKVDAFLEIAPIGCLKWQKKNGKTYYYHQYAHNNISARKYIKKQDCSLINKLAQKQYYLSIRPILQKNFNALVNFLDKNQPRELEAIYDKLSDERKKFVVPFTMSAEERVKEWQEEEYEQNRMYPENLRYDTEQGDLVRSKSEVIIANLLYQNQEDILYRYEKPLELVENERLKTIYPDFTIINIHTGEVIYWEHAGRMDDPYYANEFVKKMNTYIANGLMPGRDVVVSFETLNSPLDIKVVKQLIQQVICGY